MSPLADCAAVVLAGGRSSRMGQPKAWLEFGGLPLLQRIIRRLEARVPEFVVVAAPGQELPETGAVVVHDEAPGEGPVGGLVVGLAAARRPFALVLSCDVPFVSAAVAERLAAAAREADVAVPEWEGRLHPLQAVYRTSVQPLVAELFAAGQRRPVALYDRVRTCVVPESELRAVDPRGLSFLNLNTPADYEAARRLLEEEPG